MARNAGFDMCPGGHKLPFEKGGRSCTPVLCVENVAKSPVFKSLSKTARTEALSDHAEKVAVKKFEAKVKLAKIPDKLDGQDAIDWADKKITDLTPYAAAELEYQLKFGDDSQRMKAAERVLDSKGLGRKESANAGGALIILKGDAVITPPWKSGKVEVVDSPPVDRPTSGVRVDSTTVPSLPTPDETPTDG